MKNEIACIADTANFNGKKVLNDKLKEISFKIGDSAASGDTLRIATVALQWARILRLSLVRLTMSM